MTEIVDSSLILLVRKLRSPTSIRGYDPSLLYFSIIILYVFLHTYLDAFDNVSFKVFILFLFFFFQIYYHPVFP